MSIPLRKCIFLVSVFFVSAVSFADGFDCVSQTGGIKIVIENFRNAAEGTRNVEFMEISSLVDVKTNNIRFESSQETLRNRGTYYIAKVDLRYSQIRTSQLKIFNRPVVDFESIYLDVEFSYAKPVPDGTKVRAQFSAIERDTKDLKKMAIACTRTISG